MTEQSAPVAAPAAPVQTPAGDQGQGGNDGFWNTFPNVPQEHRPLLEPHIGEMQKHVSQLEQQYAPFKQFAEAGLDSDTTSRILSFHRDFDRAPLDMWVKIGQTLQEQVDPRTNRPVVDPAVDLEYLAAIARGEDPDAGDASALGQNAEAGVQQGEQADPRDSVIEELRAQVQQLSEGFQEDRTARQTAVQDRVYDTRLGQMRETLKTSGYPEDLLTDRELSSAVIVANGDFVAATKQLLDRRTGILKGFTQQRTDPDPTTINGDGPPSADRDVRARDRNDSWKTASRTAESRLRRQNRSEVQG